jgi:hypothetical protein
MNNDVTNNIPMDLVKWSQVHNMEVLLQLNNLLSKCKNALEILEKTVPKHLQWTKLFLLQKKNIVEQIIDYLQLVIKQRKVVLDGLCDSLSVYVDQTIHDGTHENMPTELLKRKELLIGIAAYKEKFRSDSKITEEEISLYGNFASGPHIEKISRDNIVAIEQYVELSSEQTASVFDLDQQQRHLNDITAILISFEI